MRHKKIEKVTSNKKDEFCLNKKYEQKMKYFKNGSKRMKDIEDLLEGFGYDLESKCTKYKYKNSYYCKTEINTIMNDLRDELSGLKTGKLEMDYLTNVCDILNMYNDILERENIDNSIQLKSEKEELIIDYLKITNDNTLVKFNHDLRHDEICKSCHNIMLFDLDSATFRCDECSITISTIQYAQDLSFKEKQTCDIKMPYKYEKASYLEDYLKRFEAKENKIIPQFILDKIVNQLHKEKKTNWKNLTEKQMKNCLKTIGHQDYYENVINIINRINGRPRLEISSHIKEQLHTMFKKIQEPFAKYKPVKRKSFFSYPYTLHQFFKILNLDEYCNYFILLKSEEKLRAQDELFKKVILDLQENDKDSGINWVFTPTI